ncbi:MAG: glycosyl transferase, partial [Lachnospiraceae bacterium]|nr:glycosyl transferase [Lachnospiraceae bacterium]
SILVDEKVEDGPNNADNSFAGPITLRKAVEISKNTVAWKLFQELKPEKCISYLEKMQFSRLDENDKKYLAASIGGFTHGVSTLEMAKGYATIENDGAYRDPSCILRITDADGKLIYEPAHSEEMVYEQEACREMTNIMEGVVTRGTGKGLTLGEMPCAGKTGTTDDYNDGWFVGFTRYFTTSVWVGYDTPRTIAGLSGGMYPGRIWQDYMKKIHEDLPPKAFRKPAQYYDSHEETQAPVVAQPQQQQVVTNDVGGAVDGVGTQSEAGTVDEGVNEAWEQTDDWVDETGITNDGRLPEVVEVPVQPPVDDGGDAGGVVDMTPVETPPVETPPVDPGVVDQTVPQ